jgi:GTP cyclohydrolase IA
MNYEYVTNSMINTLSCCLADKIKCDGVGPIVRIYGVPRGGIPAAYSVANALNLQGMTAYVVDNVEAADIVVDDIIASGRTMDKYAHEKPFYALIDNRRCTQDKWYVFPWESTIEGSAEDIPIRMLEYIGEDVTRNGLQDTPKRVIKAWDEIFRGYREDPATILSAKFDNEENYNQMVVLREIEFFSMCEHHLLPFFGSAHIAYIPEKDGKVIGISKLARLVDCFARRAQIQERLTQQIADAIEEHIKPMGVAVLLEAQHLCMLSRGVKKQNSVMVTSALKGSLEKEEARMEFLLLKR